MFDNFTDSMKEIMYKAQNIALENHNTMIEPIHILNAMIDSDSDSAQSLLSELKLNTNIFHSDVKNIVNNLAKASEISNQLYFSKNSLSLFEKAGEYSKQLKDKFISPEHILLSFTKIQDSDLNRIIEKYLYTKILLNLTRLFLYGRIWRI